MHFFVFFFCFLFFAAAKEKYKKLKTRLSRGKLCVLSGIGLIFSPLSQRTCQQDERMSKFFLVILTRLRVFSWKVVPE